jgi:hypothetical protein
MKKQIIFLLALFSILWIGTVAQAAIIVGRIGHLEGDIYRYMDVGNEWVETFVDSPAGTGDILATGSGSRAEIIFPNRQVVRLAENAEIEIINLDENTGEFNLVSGLVRFYNNSGKGTLKIRTKRGVVNLPAGSIADLQAEEASLQIWAVRGGSTFLKQDSNSRKETLEVIDQSTNLTIYRNSVAASLGPIDMGWHNWCAERENVWQERQLVRSQYMPEPLQVYSYTLKPHGGWRRVYYRGYNYWAWQPHNVAMGWTPYTTGYWHEWHGDRVWIDNNPWGWVTHHNGHWMQVRGSWMWTPYVHVASTPGVKVSGFSIVFGPRYRPRWHPGRVRWIAYNDYVGWMPLAPRETYYGHRRWGPRSVALKNRSGVNLSININLSDHHHLDHAVVIPRDHFNRRSKTVAKNYNTVKIKNINKTVIVNNYQPLPTITKGKQAKRKQVVKVQTRSRTQVTSPVTKVNRKRVVTLEKNKRVKQIDNPVLTKTKALYKERVVTAGKRTDNPAKVIRKNVITRQERTISTRNAVQGELMVNLEKKPKRASVKRKIKQVVSYDRNKVAFSGRQATTGQVKTAEKNEKKRVEKYRDSKKAKKQKVEQAEEGRGKKYSSRQAMETREQDEREESGRRERYSMNHSGSASLSSLSNRRGRF